MSIFITLEGGDGSGKSTLRSKIETYFKKTGVPFITTREPGGTPLGEKIREVLKEKPSPLAELFLFEASRSEHVQNRIKPALKKGTAVLCDRFTHSSLAYQGVVSGLGINLVERLNNLATSGLKPDAVIWLKISPEKARKRLKHRGIESWQDRQALSFHKKVYNAFEKMAKKSPKQFIVLDASCSADEVFKELLAHSKWKKLMTKVVRKNTRRKGKR